MIGAALLKILLKKSLGEFIAAELDVQQLSLGLGTAELKDLLLDVSAINNAANLPHAQLNSGWIGKLNLQISPPRLSVEDVVLCVDVLPEQGPRPPTETEQNGTEDEANQQEDTADATIYSGVQTLAAMLRSFWQKVTIQVERVTLRVATPNATGSILSICLEKVICNNSVVSNMYIQRNLSFSGLAIRLLNDGDGATLTEDCGGSVQLQLTTSSDGIQPQFGVVIKLDDINFRFSPGMLGPALSLVNVLQSAPAASNLGMELTAHSNGSPSQWGRHSLIEGLLLPDTEHLAWQTLKASRSEGITGQEELDEFFDSHSVLSWMSQGSEDLQGFQQAGDWSHSLEVLAASIHEAATELPMWHISLDIPSMTINLGLSPSPSHCISLVISGINASGQKHGDDVSYALSVLHFQLDSYTNGSDDIESIGHLLGLLPDESLRCRIPDKRPLETTVAELGSLSVTAGKWQKTKASPIIISSYCDSVDSSGCSLLLFSSFNGLDKLADMSIAMQPVGIFLHPPFMVALNSLMEAYGPDIAALTSLKSIPEQDTGQLSSSITLYPSRITILASLPSSGSASGATHIAADILFSTVPARHLVRMLSRYKPSTASARDIMERLDEIGSDRVEAVSTGSSKGAIYLEGVKFFSIDAAQSRCQNIASVVCFSERKVDNKGTPSGTWTSRRSTAVKTEDSGFEMAWMAVDKEMAAPFEDNLGTYHADLDNDGRIALDQAWKELSSRSAATFHLSFQSIHIESTALQLPLNELILQCSPPGAVADTPSQPSISSSVECQIFSIGQSIQASQEELTVRATGVRLTHVTIEDIRIFSTQVCNLQVSNTSNEFLTSGGEYGPAVDFVNMHRFGMHAEKTRIRVNGLHLTAKNMKELGWISALSENLRSDQPDNDRPADVMVHLKHATLCTANNEAPGSFRVGELAWRKCSSEISFPTLLRDVALAVGGTDALIQEKAVHIYGNGSNTRICAHRTIVNANLPRLQLAKEMMEEFFHDPSHKETSDTSTVGRDSEGSWYKDSPLGQALINDYIASTDIEAKNEQKELPPGSQTCVIELEPVDIDDSLESTAIMVQLPRTSWSPADVRDLGIHGKGYWYEDSGLSVLINDYIMNGQPNYEQRGLPADAAAACQTRTVEFQSVDIVLSIAEDSFMAGIGFVNAKLKLHLSNVSYEKYTFDGSSAGISERIDLRIEKLHAEDSSSIATSPGACREDRWRPILDIDSKVPRDPSDPFCRLVAECTHGKEEWRIRTALSPIRIRLHQLTVMIILDMFSRVEEKDDEGSEVVQTVMNIQKCMIGAFPIRVTYKPRALSIPSLASGNSLEALNLIPPLSFKVECRRLILARFYGAAQLANAATAKWRDDIVGKQKGRIVSGLPLFRYIFDTISVTRRAYREDPSTQHWHQGREMTARRRLHRAVSAFVQDIIQG